jgi:hypothetical protein
LLPAARETGTDSDKFDTERGGWGYDEFIALSELRDAAAGWLKNDAVVLRVDVIVEREDRFQLDTGAPGCIAH